KADERKELVHDLEVLNQDEEQQRLEPGREVGHCSGEDEDHVEVDAAEVGAQPAASAEPVGIRDIGVEGGPDDVDPGADAARPRTATMPSGTSFSSARYRAPLPVKPRPNARVTRAAISS